MPRSAALPALFAALLAMGYAQFGALVRFEVDRVALQRAMKLRLKQGVAEEELTTFTFTEQEWRGLHWVKAGREFRLADGRMFDVVRQVAAPSGHLRVQCIADHQETALFAGLEQAVEHAQQGGAPKGRDRVIELLSTMHPCPQAEAPAWPATGRHSGIPLACGLLSGHSDPFELPPQG